VGLSRPEEMRVNHALTSWSSRRLLSWLCCTTVKSRGGRAAAPWSLLAMESSSQWPSPVHRPVRLHHRLEWSLSHGC
jgi:hypothetical protein